MTLDEFLGESGWTKADIAKKVGISEAAVSQWINIPDSRLEVLNRLLGKTSSGGEAEVSFDGIVKVIDETPVELRKVLRREWKVKGGQVYWQRKWWGHGSEYDFQYSAAQLRRWGKELKRFSRSELLDRVQADRSMVSGLIPGIDCTVEQNRKQMMDILSAVHANGICPIVVDEVENRWVNGKSISFRVNPWERLS